MPWPRRCSGCSGAEPRCPGAGRRHHGLPPGRIHHAAKDGGRDGRAAEHHGAAPRRYRLVRHRRGLGGPGTAEIGIRMAMGARPGQVVAMLVREVMVLVASGAALGLAAALLLAPGLRGLVFGVRGQVPLPSWASRRSSPSSPSWPRGSPPGRPPARGRWRRCDRDSGQWAVGSGHAVTLSRRGYAVPASRPRAASRRAGSGANPAAARQALESPSARGPYNVGHDHLPPGGPAMHSRRLSFIALMLTASVLAAGAAAAQEPGPCPPHGSPRA